MTNYKIRCIINSDFRKEGRKMVKRYKLIKQDTFKKLKLGKIYLIKDFGNSYAIVNTTEEK